VDDNHRPARVYRHRIGTEQAADELIYVEPLPGWFVDIDETSSGAFAVITVSDHETSEAYLLDRADPHAEPRLVSAREPHVIYHVEHHGSDLIIRTNDGGAEDFKLVTAPLDRPERSGWRDLVPHRPGVMVLFHTLFARHMVRLERENANPRIVVRDLWSADEHAISFDEEPTRSGSTSATSSTRRSCASPTRP
jgi:oligopeptidase B